MNDIDRILIALSNASLVQGEAELQNHVSMIAATDMVEALDTATEGVSCIITGSSHSPVISLGTSEYLLEISFLYDFMLDAFVIQIEDIILNPEPEASDVHLFGKLNSSRVTIEELYGAIRTVLTKKESMKGFTYETPLD